VTVPGPNLLKRSIFLRSIAVICIYASCVYATLPLTMQAQTAATSAPAATQTSLPVRFDMPKSHNPLSAYSPDYVPEPVLANSPRLDLHIRDGKLYLALKDCINLALENNLDLAIARYNLPIANTDILRTQAGGFFRGVNTGVVQGTPGGGVGGFGTGAPGAGAGGTTSGAGGAGAGASGLVQSTLGAGTAVSSYDPLISASVGDEHQTSPVINQAIYGVPSLQLNTGQFNVNYSQAFATGTSISFSFNNQRQTTNSPDFTLSPTLTSLYRFTIQQELLAGFGFGPNLRYLRIAKNNKKISDIAFKDQVIATVTQIENMYWDLVSAYEQTQVNEQSSAFAQQTLENARKQLQLQSIPEMDVLRAEAEVSKRDQDLTVARTSLELQETLMKNAVTKSLDDPVLEAMPVVPTDRMEACSLRPPSRFRI
jgi:outer membrane protein TolC